jgi:Tol biopolymer transport system component
LTNTPHSQTVNDWSPDGKFLLYTETSTEAELDLLGAADERRSQTVCLHETRLQEFGGRFSPDGKWISSISNESGRQEVYVRSFPWTANRQQVSINEGSNSIWRKDGKEPSINCLRELNGGLG